MPDQRPQEDAEDRFRRLSNSEEAGDSARPDDTQPSRPVKAEPLGDTQPSRAMRVGDVPADEAPTIFPAAPGADWAPAPPPLGDTPVGAPPPMDTSGMPLPPRSGHPDPDATQMTTAAFQEAPTKPMPSSQTFGDKFKAGWNSFRQRFGRMGCLPQLFIGAGFALIFLLVAGGAFALYEYNAIASTLPSVEDLQGHASQFETTRILDANGNLLYEILDPNAGRRTYVRLEDISPYLVAATLATEDEEFYNHPGFNIGAIFRAFFQNSSSGGIVSGASTITQQLAKALLFTPEEATEQSYLRKVREAILAAEITRRYSKDEILELYLNENYYGNLAYGVEAAAETYFGSNAGSLTLAQASLLAGLPQAPSVYDVYTNLDTTLGRQQTVLALMVKLSAERGCIYVSNSTERVCVSVDEGAAAGLEMLDYEFNSPDVQIRYPHWVNYVRYLLEQQYDPQTIYRSGFTVYTTLDPKMQDMAQATVSSHVAELADKHVGSGALVAIRPSDGHILAMVGSADFYNDDIDGQINMAVSPRQPGSSIKPLTYVAAFEKGWTPSTLIWDVESEFPPSGDPNDTREPYIPTNYDNRYHGPVLLRQALGNSYNVPAVKALDFVGIYDNPDTPEEEGLVAFAHRMGITDLNGDQYGLALTLGGGEVKLLDLTNAYAIFAHQGQRVNPVAITKIVDFQGNTVYEEPQPSTEQVIRPEHAFLISSILSDNSARQPSFSVNNTLNLPFRVAAKTGTTTDFRDNWTLGYTPDIAIGVWVGNPDNTEMQGTSGLTGAAPIWADFMQQAVNYLVGGNPASFVQPSGVVEKVVCRVSGAEPSQYCDDDKTELFTVDQPPADADHDLWQDAIIDTWTGYEASDACGDEFTDEIFTMNVSDPWGIKWITQTSAGREWAKDNDFKDPIIFSPSRACKDSDPRPTLEIISPDDGEHLTAPQVEVRIVADATDNFDQWVLEWRRGDSGSKDWKELANKHNPVSGPQNVYTLDLQDFPRGALVLRLTMESTGSGYAQVEITIHNDLPEPTAIPTNTPQPTATATDTPLPSSTPTNTSIPPTSTPTSVPPTSAPSNTPTNPPPTATDTP